MVAAFKRYLECRDDDKEGVGRKTRVLNIIKECASEIDDQETLNWINFGRYEEELRHHQQDLAQREVDNKSVSLSVVVLRIKVGDALQNLGRYEEALKYYQESLALLEMHYSREVNRITATLFSIGIILQRLQKFEEAFKNVEKIIAVCEKSASPSANLRELNGFRDHIIDCTILLANQNILQGNLDQALIHYRGMNVKIELGLVKVIPYLAIKNWQAGKILVAISCFEALSEKLIPQDRGVKHNLACAYHVMAMEERNENRWRESEGFLGKAKETFDRALSIGCNEPIKASLYVEYAMFLLIHHNSMNDEEYSIIVAYLNSAITSKEDGSGLSYGRVEKCVVVEPIQELLKKQKEIIIKPHILANYLLVKLHCMHNNKEHAEEALKEFIEEVEKLKDSKDKPAALYLLSWCDKEIESLKIQQVAKPRLTSAFHASEQVMAERREATTATLLQTLPHNHIGIIWEYYVGREHRILCELKMLFNTILSKSEEILKTGIGENNRHIDFIIEYGEGVPVPESGRAEIIDEDDKGISKSKDLKR